MVVRVTVLIENTATSRRGIVGEHGLSFLIETDKRRFLLDAGPGVNTVNNAAKLGVDLRGLNGLLLSHGHYDHTGGLQEILRVTGELQVYAHPSIFEPKYKVKAGMADEYIGIPWSKAELEASGAIFHLSKAPVALTPNLLLTGEIPRRYAFEAEDEGFRLKDGDHYRDDLLWDDQAVIIKTPTGLVVIFGCAHAGIVNSLAQAVELTGISKIRCVLGGTHLWHASPSRMTQTIQMLQAMGVGQLSVCHCTGFAAAAQLAQHWGEDCCVCNAGMVFEF